MNIIKKIYLDENGEIKIKTIDPKDFYKSYEELEEEIKQSENNNTNNDATS